MKRRDFSLAAIGAASVAGLPLMAQAQRAKTSLLGLDAKVSERDQGGRTVYRVRVGPVDKAEAERVRAKLEAAHIDSAMVRVQR